MTALAGLALFITALATVAIFAGWIGRNPKIKKIGVFLMALVFAVLLVFMLSGFFNTDWRGLRSWYLIPMALALIVVGFVGYFKNKHDWYFLGIAPLTFIILCAAYFYTQGEGEFNTTLSGPIFWVHLSMVFIGIGLMALATVAGVLFIWQERALKNKKKLSTLPKDLPSLTSLDKVNAFATNVGFPLYFLGVLTGFLWAYISWGKIFSADPKEFMSLFILCLYAYLFHRRQAHNSHGRKPAILAICIFVASLFSIVFVNTLLSTHHSF